MTQRVYNFSPGPAVLPEPVLAEVQRDFMALPGVGASIVEISHRSKAFEDILKQAEINLRQLLKIPDDYAVLFLQGGARLQFSMIPMNLAGEGRQSFDYLVTGSWSKYAAQEAAKYGELHTAGTARRRISIGCPRPRDLKLDPQAASSITHRTKRFRACSSPRSRPSAMCRSCATLRATFSAGRSTFASTACSTPAPRRMPARPA